MKYLLLIISSLFLISCYERDSKESVAHDLISPDVKIKEDSFKKTINIFLRDTINNPFLFQNLSDKDPDIIDFPFGSDILVNYNFPVNYEREYPEEEQTESTHDIKLNEVGKYYLELYQNSNAYKLPPIDKYNYIRIPFTVDISDSIPNFRSSGYYNYKLPNIGVYSVYYVGYLFNFNSNKYPLYVTSGYLILYNKTLRSATIINVYINIEDGYNTFLRFFYVSEDKFIMLYDRTQNDTFSIKNRVYKLHIDKAGKINVQKNTYHLPE